MKICDKCGTQNDDVAFCKQCGAKLAADEQSVPDATEPTASEGPTAAKKPKIGVGTILSSSALACVLLQVFLSMVFGIAINLIFRTGVGDVVESVNAMSLVSVVVSYLFLIAASGLSVAGTVMAFIDKKACAEAKLRSKVYSIAIVVFCVLALILTIASSIANTVLM